MSSYLATSLGHIVHKSFLPYPKALARECNLIRSQTWLVERATGRRALLATQCTLAKSVPKRHYSISTRLCLSHDGGVRYGTRTSNAGPLPSQNESQRWQISKRWSRLMDNLLARASVAGQHINVYTGTDYTGIEALRQEILRREEAVRQQHATVAEAKEVHVQSRQKQAVSQKEIVGLLERKSSWSPEDLERYMALVRSGHVDDQAVQHASEELAMAERRLETSRSHLEKLERQQYHEEQIWSDTIRRNSTWVTMGLMGINIVLLLAQISIFEPYRRRKIVDQIEQALDQRSALGPAPSTVSMASEPPTEPVEPAAPLVDVALSSQITTTPVAIVDDLALQEDTQAPVSTTWDMLKTASVDLLSSRNIQMRQYERTALVLESVAAGVGLAFICSLAVLKSG